jgi:hypothetical protein
MQLAPWINTRKMLLAEFLECSSQISVHNLYLSLDAVAGNGYACSLFQTDELLGIPVVLSPDIALEVNWACRHVEMPNPPTLTFHTASEFPNHPVSSTNTQPAQNRECLDPAPAEVCVGQV